MTPDFYIVFSDEKFIVISDMNLGKTSVTNGIQKVLCTLSAKFTISKMHIIYQDSMGIYDAVLTDVDGNFERFYCLGKRDYKEAIEEYKKLIKV